MRDESSPTKVVVEVPAREYCLPDCMYLCTVVHESPIWIVISSCPVGYLIYSL